MLTGVKKLGHRLQIQQALKAHRDRLMSPPSRALGEITNNNRAQTPPSKEVATPRFPTLDTPSIAEHTRVAEEEEDDDFECVLEDNNPTSVTPPAAEAPVAPAPASILARLPSQLVCASVCLVVALTVLSIRVSLPLAERLAARTPFRARGLSLVGRVRLATGLTA